MSELFSSQGEWFWQMCQFLVVAISLFLILRQLRLQGHSHLVNSFAGLGDRWNSDMMLKARKQVCQEYEHGQKQIHPAMQHVCLFFEELGAYCKKKVLNRDLVWELYSFEIEHYWKLCSNAIIEYRNSCKDDTFYHLFQYLSQEMKLVSGRNNAPTHDKTDDEVTRFIEHEILRVDYFLGVATANHVMTEVGAGSNGRSTSTRRGKSSK